MDTMSNALLSLGEGWDCRKIYIQNHLHLQKSDATGNKGKDDSGVSAESSQQGAV